MPSQKFIVGIIVFIVILGGVWVLLGGGAPQQEATTEEEETQEVVSQQQEITVTYTDEGYAPAEIRIVPGNIVTFVNESSGPMWTASAMHPTHEVYPGTSLASCGNTTEAMFDMCAPVEPGGSWEFRFGESGLWGYHNHIMPDHTGRVMVD